MSTISASTAAYTARAGLLAAVRAALADETKVDIDAGFLGQPGHNDWVAMGETIGVDVDPKTVGPRRQRDETITLTLNVGAFKPGHTEAAVVAAFTRADDLLRLISTYVSAGENTELGGVVAWCLPGSADWVGAEIDGGFQVEIAATFICAHRVRAA
ncbi:hypothetical protein [Microbacterium rhizomatis]|uniref:Uncharacterized protein n=1 Tax=Microbacterium rhizomatis TaxID=1631477 RepID=A0A5J5J253_9MICO|nr:hypothetical protein [Microbacterium rhizomatis]KAA9110181.1 hypothetical protein F6B43_00275 [Microbacterium rhizomatis]